MIAAKKANDVDVATVEKGTVREELVLSGEIAADEFANMAFASGGKLSWVGVTEGQEVKKGEALVRINPTGASQDLKIADATLREEASTLDRVYDDLKEKEDDETFSEKETRTAAETAKDRAVFGYIKAQNILANTTLTAPFDGFISFIAHPFAGINVLATETQIQVVNPETIYFEVSADQSEVIDIKDGQRVIIVLDSFSDEEIGASVDFVSYAPLAGEAGAVYRVKVKLDEGVDISQIKVGMTGDAKFIMEEKEDVLWVPPKFVNSNTKGKYVNKGRKNNKVYVEVGLEGEERVEIKGAINEGDKVYD